MEKAAASSELIHSDDRTGEGVEKKKVTCGMIHEGGCSMMPQSAAERASSGKRTQGYPPILGRRGVCGIREHRTGGKQRGGRPERSIGGKKPKKACRIEKKKAPGKKLKLEMCRQEHNHPRQGNRVS